MGIIFESVTNDYKIRQDISTIVDIVIDKVSEDFSKYFSEVDNLPFVAYVFDYDDIKEDVGIDFPRFRILLRPPYEGHDTIKAAYSKSGIVHVMVDFSSDLVEQIKGIKAFIVHELIHHYDNVISSGRNSNSVGDDLKVSDEEYYNNTSEINAYYHEALYRVEKNHDGFVSRLDFERYAKIVDKLYSTFDKFYDGFKYNIDKDFLENATYTTLRTIRKRLYLYYTDVFYPAVEATLENKRMDS